ncbi:MAG: response regulator transcription factor [Phycisphaerales bacterium]|nr:response regulator transcription factor [Phycisphaerales bacterium]
MSAETVLVVEDEAEIADLIKFHLERDGFRVSVARSGRKALESVQVLEPALLLLDLMLPEIDGLEVCRRIRANNEHADLPILMLTAKGSESDIVAGLELGADDYMTKPFSPRVLLARVRALLRRNSAADSAGGRVLSLLGGRLQIDAVRHVVSVDGAPIELTITEFELLRHLALRPGFVRTRDQIIAAVHGANTILSSRTVDVHVTAVRRKLGPLTDAVETVRGVGYRFCEAPTV